MIYFDSAATTLQKPTVVARATARAMGRLASPGRGGHRPAMEAAEVAFTCRQAAAQLFDVSDPERVVFTFNATHALNLAIKSLVGPTDTVLISGYEHNAVTRPLQALGAKIKVADTPLFRPQSMLAQFDALLTPEVRCVICNHVSNVFGYVLPVEGIASLCHARGVPLILDASQSAGSLPVHLEALGAAFIAMPGHKGLFGPQGTGLLLCGEGVEVSPLLEGGTGSSSALQNMPDFLPDRLESGTHNICGIAGLLEGIRFVQRKGVDTIAAHEKRLMMQAADALTARGGIWAYVDQSQSCQSGVLSMNIAGRDCEEVAGELGRRGVCVRAGLHCAPLAHRTAGTLETGTVRLSFSPFNTAREVQSFLEEIDRLL